MSGPHLVLSQVHGGMAGLSKRRKDPNRRRQGTCPCALPHAGNSSRLSVAPLLVSSFRFWCASCGMQGESGCSCCARRLPPLESREDTCLPQRTMERPLEEQYQLGETILQRRKQGLLAVGKQRIPLSMRSRRNQLWCRTEDVRTISEGNMSIHRWKIETQPAIGNMAQGGQPQKRSTQGGETTHKQPTDKREEEDNENGLESRIMKPESSGSNMWDKGIPWRREDEGDEWQRWDGSWWIRVDQDGLNSRQRRKISRDCGEWWIVKETGWQGCCKN